MLFKINKLTYNKLASATILDKLKSPIIQIRKKQLNSSSTLTKTPISLSLNNLFGTSPQTPSK
jgi:hypothetical protein